MAYEAGMHAEGEALRKGAWPQEDDDQLTSVPSLLVLENENGIPLPKLLDWGEAAKVAGCHFRSNLKHGPFSVEEEQLILQLQQQRGNNWSKIARRLPGRTDNEIKNYRRTHLRKKSQVQELVEFQHKLENSAQEKSTDMVSLDHCLMNLDTQESELRTKYSSFDVLPLSEWQLTRSPYETRILDWIADF